MCYRFEKYNFYDSLLKKVDATYIIHLENNGRLTRIYDQLKEYHPTNIVYILFNKGYKNCEKKDDINSPPVDLVDAFLTAFKHAQNQGYDNILILEDDFMFTKDINTEAVQVDKFLSGHLNEKFIYYLGLVPWLQMPFDGENYMPLISTGSHACIYSKEARISLLSQKQSLIKDWDIHNNLYSMVSRYAYYKPLCFQLFPETENSRHWDDTFGLSSLVKFIFKILGMDKKIQPGYDILYLVSKSIFWIFIICVVYFVVTRL